MYYTIMNKIELLAPAGDFERLVAAIHFKCDAVYFAGKRFGLRSFSSNFNDEEILSAINYAHEHNVKAYITVNILAHNEDFLGLVEYLKYLEECKADGVIVSDFGIASLVVKHTSLELHISTQANITNIYSAKAWVELGAKRLVLARELSLKEIKEIKEAVGDEIEIECFVHGAMCISYSGRCLLSNYMTGRDSNKGECAQPCRWEYNISEKNFDKEEKEIYPIKEDERGTYVFNSKDMCLINHIKELVEAGITSFKIEGRMKSSYYVATVTNAYRKAIDDYLYSRIPSFDYINELNKTSNRKFTTGFYFNCQDKTYTLSSEYKRTHDYIAKVLEDSKDGYCLVELRNKFKLGDVLEVLSPTKSFLKNLEVEEILDKSNNRMEEVKRIKEKVYLKTDIELKKDDILRRKRND